MPPRSAQPPSTSSTARRSLPSYSDAAAKLPKSAQSPGALRAKLFAALESQTSERIRAESIDALLASSKDARIEIPMAQALAKASGGFAQDTQSANSPRQACASQPSPATIKAAWDLTEPGGDRVRSWQLLLVTTDPLSERARTALDPASIPPLKAVTAPDPLLTTPGHSGASMCSAKRSRSPLWDLAAQAPQPDDGFLPATGVLSALKEAADKGEDPDFTSSACRRCILGPTGRKARI